MDLEKRLKQTGFSFSNVRQTYASFRRKIKKQKGKTLSLHSLVKLHFVEEDMRNLKKSMEDLINSLNQQGYWELEDQDYERLKEEEETKELLDVFLPQITNYIVNKKENLPISSSHKFCVFL
jgi:hypothetical protein